MTTKTEIRHRKPEADAEAKLVKGQPEETTSTAFNEFLDHQRRALEETGEAILSLVPKQVQDHSKTAYKEAIEGYRGLFNSVIDDIVDRIERMRMDSENPGNHKN